MIKRIKLLGYKCYRCRYEWLPRSKRIPKQCPGCKSIWWNKPKGYWRIERKRQMESLAKKALSEITSKL